MQRIDTTTAVAALPAPAATAAPGYFTGGNGGPGTPVPATNLSADWCNNIQEELMAILTAAGIVGDKTKNNQVLTALQTIWRIAPQANVNFYLDFVNGNDANSGLAAGAGNAWKSLAHAEQVIRTRYDWGGQYQPTINIADSTNYVGGATFYPCVGIGVNNPIRIIGNIANPQNVAFSDQIISNGVDIFIDGVSIANGAQNGFVAGVQGHVFSIGTHCRVGSLTGGGAALYASGGLLNVQSLYVNGNMGAVIRSYGPGGGVDVQGGGNFTIGGAMTVSAAFCDCGLQSVINFNQSGGVTAFTNPGNITGSKFLVGPSSLIDSLGQSLSWLPGTVAGTVITPTAGSQGSYQ